MGRLSALPATQPSPSLTSAWDGRHETDLGHLHGCRLAVPFGLEQVGAQLVRVYGLPPHVQARVAVADPAVTGDEAHRAGKLEIELHISELPWPLQHALRDLDCQRTGAASPP